MESKLYNIANKKEGQGKAMTKRVICALLSGILVVGNMGLGSTGPWDAGQRAVGLGSFVSYLCGGQCCGTWNPGSGWDQ